MPSPIKCLRAARINAPPLRWRIPLIAFCLFMGFGPFGVTSRSEDNVKVPGEDLIARTLELLDAQLRYDQLAANRRISVVDLKRLHLKYLEQLVGDESLTQIRAICAAHRMPWLRDVVQSKQVQLPDTPVYCLKAIEVSARGNMLSDLYINLALQAQGRESFDSAKDAALLKDNEAGRTRAAIFKAANAGEPAYAGITGQQRPLPCPLAFDAGYAFGYRNPDKNQPVEFTANEAEAIVRACYDPSAMEITLKGDKLAVSRAGVLAGASLGRRAKLEGSLSR